VQPCFVIPLNLGFLTLNSFQVYIILHISPSLFIIKFRWYSVSLLAHYFIKILDNWSIFSWKKILTLNKQKILLCSSKFHIYRVSQWTWELNDDFYFVFVPSGIISWILFCITLKHLTPKTTCLGISKMSSTIFSLSKLTEISGNLSRFQLIKN